MTGGDALYEAILAAPADDLPRLVYADWLEEHGDAERAEFIRAQITGDHVRANRLLEHNRPAWSITGLRGVQSFARGFVDEVWASAEEVVARAETLLRFPLRGLRITAADDHVKGLAGLPVLARITSLDLSNNTRIHNHFDRLFYNGGLRNLTSLIIRNVRVWGEALPRWPMIPAFPKLTHLDLSGNPIGDEGLATLAEHPGFSSLQSILLRGDGQELHDLIGDEGLARLARSPLLGSLIRLDLSDNAIGTLGIESLVKSDRPMAFMELNLSENAIGLIGLAALARWPRLAEIDAVILRGPNLFAEARAELLASPWASKFILDEPTAIA